VITLFSSDDATTTTTTHTKTATKLSTLKIQQKKSRFADKVEVSNEFDLSHTSLSNRVSSKLAKGKKENNEMLHEKGER